MVFSAFLNEPEIKSILMHECQHKSTRINTNQHECEANQHKSKTSQRKSTRVWHESTRINTSSTRVNTSQLDQEIIIVYSSFS